MAMYVDRGVDVLVVTCTGGERGSILNPNMATPGVLENIAEIRRQEMERAREILGVDQAWLGHVDSGFPEGDPLPPLPEGSFGLMDVAEAAEPLVRLVRSFRPHVMTTYDENGGYPHPDHVMCHKVSVAAFEAAGDPDAYPGTGEPWQPAEALLQPLLPPRPDRGAARGDGAARPGVALRGALGRVGADPEHERRVTTRVPCADYFATRDKALLAHATQVDPEGGWFTVPLEVHMLAWPTEDYELARTHVDSTLPEDDLFAGVVLDQDGISPADVPTPEEQLP